MTSPLSSFKSPSWQVCTGEGWPSAGALNTASDRKAGSAAYREAHIDMGILPVGTETVIDLMT
jgi:hypothetical protein